MSDLNTKRQAIRKVVILAIQQGKAEEDGFTAAARKVEIAELFEEETEYDVEGWSVTELFDITQGVTWGGEGCEEIYVVDKTVASMLESKLVYKTIGGRDITSYTLDWKGKYLVFPYLKSASKWMPAFRHPTLGGDDALDFSEPISNYEKGKDVEAILTYRIAKNIVGFPNTAKYLIKHYSKLEKREFENKKLEEYNKCWYEYHRPRTPTLVTKPKIVCKRVMKTPAFALDEKGYLPRDSVMSITPRKKFNELRENLQKVLRNEVTTIQALEYSLKFLNSEVFQELLEKRRSKKRGGYPIIDERLLGRFRIPKVTMKDVSAVKEILKGNEKTINLRALYRLQKKSQAELPKS